MSSRIRTDSRRGGTEEADSTPGQSSAAIGDPVLPLDYGAVNQCRNCLLSFSDSEPSYCLVRQQRLVGLCSVCYECGRVAELLRHFDTNPSVRAAAHLALSEINVFLSSERELELSVLRAIELSEDAAKGEGEGEEQEWPSTAGELEGTRSSSAGQSKRRRH